MLIRGEQSENSLLAIGFTFVFNHIVKQRLLNATVINCLLDIMVHFN